MTGENDGGKRMAPKVEEQIKENPIEDSRGECESWLPRMDSNHD